MLRLMLVYNLQLQDRVGEAMQVFKTVDESTLNNSMRL